LTSWYPSEGQPFLGNYIQQFAEMMSSTCRVTVVLLEKNDVLVGEMLLENKNDNFQEIRFFYSESILNISKIRAHRKALAFVQAYFPSIDIIHTQVGMTNWWHFLWFKRVLRLPLVYSEHGSFYVKENFKQVNFINRLGLKRLLYESNEVTAVSELLKKEMTRNYPKYIHVIGNVLPKTWESLSLSEKNDRNTYRFLHISTLDHPKNPEGILEAISILKKKGQTNFSLTILSDENTDILQSIVMKEDLNDLVNFLGPHSHNNLPKVYQDHDCFILNSNHETFSIVLAEAMFFGLNIISTKVGFLANKEVAPFDEVIKNNPPQLAQKMEEAIIETKYSGEASRRFVKQFSQDEIIRKYSDIYNRLIK
jgi:glycosyltransferase involved in cell wall biosynthesis